MNQLKIVITVYKVNYGASICRAIKEQLRRIVAKTEIETGTEKERQTETLTERRRGRASFVAAWVACAK